jgi:hypothetical protein
MMFVVAHTCLVCGEDIMQLHKFGSNIVRAVLVGAACASLVGSVPAQAASTQSPTADPTASGNVAYVFRRDTPDILQYPAFLTAKGYAVTLVPLGAVLGIDFTKFDLTVIADDTGNLNTWGIPPTTAAQVTQITSARKPILGIGEGGYAFFGQVPDFIGWPQGWHGPQALLDRAPGAPAPIFSSPNVLPAGTIKVYSNPSNEVGIYLAGAPADVIAVGMEPPSPDHASMVFQGCHFLWGFSDDPTKMTGDGQALFENYVQYARFFQCGGDKPTLPDTCYRFSKSAVPPDGSTVTPGTVIEYLITYAINPTGGPNCPKEGRIRDVIPDDTLYVPGSASDGIAPAGDGSLTWVVAGSGIKRFKVTVLDTACRQSVAGAPGGLITNKATLHLPGFAPVDSNIVTHKVQCHPIGFPNDQPPYAEDEVQIYPYPIIAGKPTEISVKLTNNTASPVTAVVRFQASPDKFGIGIAFSDFATKTVTIPANSNIIVKTTSTFAAPGHFCIQIRVDVPGHPPLLTQRNLDVTEDLKPGVTDILTFSVGNPTTATATINLVVVNTCPGWNAVVVPSSVVLPAGGVTTAQLQTTPPNPILLGSGCHIDVQGYIGDKLIGGIRKLDVPPIHLPHPDIPWEEKEITVNPNPPVTGQNTQLCAAVQNPLPVARQVTLEFAVADFGAGIPFTTVGTTTVILPPNSFNNYCVNWVPAPGGTLHRCIRVTLKQPNYIDDHSQRNINVVRPLRGQEGALKVPLKIMNPDGISHTLKLNVNLIGVDPTWQLDLKTDDGLLLPAVIGPGQTLGILIGLIPVPTAGASAQDADAVSATAADDPRFGDGTSAQVNVLFDGKSVGGFTVEFGEPLTVHAPLIARDHTPQ